MAADAPAIWSPSVSPYIVVLEPAPSGFAHAGALDLAAWPLIIADHLLSDGRHIVIADIDGPHHIWLRCDDSSEPLAFSVPRDEFGTLRHIASERLDRRLRGAPPARAGQVHRPSAYQRHRLQMLLAILDLTDGGSDRPITTRAIARRLVYPNVHFGSSAEWKSSSHRRQTQRLIDEAHRLMAGGYRAILKGPFKVRQ